MKNQSTESIRELLHQSTPVAQITVTLYPPITSGVCTGRAYVEVGRNDLREFMVVGNLYDLIHKEPQELMRSCGGEFDYFIPQFSADASGCVEMRAVFWKLNK